MTTIAPPIPANPDAPPPASAHASDRDEYVRVGDVLDVHKGHGFEAMAESADQDAPEPCLLILPKQIRPFFVSDAREEVWVSYDATVEHLAKSQPKAHTRPHRREMVFAPIKLVIAESEAPLQVAVTWRPAYPTRGKLAVLQQGQPLAAIFLALGVLNSAIGQALYRKEVAKRKPGGRKPSDGVLQDALEHVPLWHREQGERFVEEIATLAFRLSVICEAQPRLTLDISGDVAAIRNHLCTAVATGLALSEPEARALLESVADLDLPEAPSRQMLLAGFSPLDSLPAMGRIDLLTDAERAELGKLRGRSFGDRLSETEVERLEELAELEDIEACANGPLPRWVEPTEPPLEREERNGHVYEYLPIGEHVVAAPGVCGGRPTFKHTRVRVVHVLDQLDAGRPAEDIVTGLGGQITMAAVEEALELRRRCGNEFVVLGPLGDDWRE